MKVHTTQIWVALLFLTKCMCVGFQTEESQGYYHVLEEIMTHDANFTDIYALFLKDQSFEEQLRLLCDMTGL